MALIYKDRAKQKLESNSWVLSAPEDGYVALPVGKEFECAIVCQDGTWMTFVAEVAEQPPGTFVVQTISGPYENSDGNSSNIFGGGPAFASNPADIFCTVRAETMTALSQIIENTGITQRIAKEVEVSDSYTEEELIIPLWTGHPGCSINTVEYDYEVYARKQSEEGIPRMKWVGRAIYSGGMLDRADGGITCVFGDGDPSFVVTGAIDTFAGGGKPVLSVSCSNTSGETGYFKIIAIVKNLDHPSSCG